MREIRNMADSPGAWVRLCHGAAVVALQRWPGPHRPGAVISTSEGCCYRYSGLDDCVQDGPEVIYQTGLTDCLPSARRGGDEPVRIHVDEAFEP